VTDTPSTPVAFIFGATGGIGSALARRLSSGGWRLTLAVRGRERLETLGNELGVHVEPADVTDSKAVEKAFAAAYEKFVRLDGVVNCCGSILLKPVPLTTDEEWSHTLSANLTTAFYVLRAAASRMMHTGGGSIVLMSSAVAQRGMINHEEIAATKAGVIGLAQSAAATYARYYHIRVNCVAPGLTRTPLTEPLTKNEASLKASAAHPLGRIGEPNEVASTIA